MAIKTRILTVEGKDFTVRWTGGFDQPNYPGLSTQGYTYTGCINEYRLPFLHDTEEHLLFCAWEWAKASISYPDCMENSLGKPESLEGFFSCTTEELL
jgi:hypothetical protein